MINKDMVSEKQAFCLMLLYSMAGVIIFGWNEQAGKDSWLINIFAFAAVLPFLLIYIRIIALYRGKEFFEIIEIVFGKWIGKIIVLLYFLFSITAGAFYLYIYSEYVGTETLTLTPVYMISFLIIILVIWVLKKETGTLGRCAVIAAPIVYILISAILILAIPQLNFDYLFPILNIGKMQLAKGTFSLMSAPYGEMLLLMAVFSKLNNKTNPYKPFLLGAGIGAVFVSMIFLRDLLLVGEGGLKILTFTSHPAVGVIKIGDFFQRFEIILTVNTLFVNLTKVSICLLFAAKALQKLFNLKDYKPIVFPVAILSYALSGVIFKNLIELFDRLKIIDYIRAPFLFILPVIIWIGAEIKSRLDKNKTEKKKQPQPEET